MVKKKKKWKQSWKKRKKEIILLKFEHEKEKEILHFVEKQIQEAKQIFYEEQQALRIIGEKIEDDKVLIRRLADLKKEQQQKQSNIEEGFTAGLADIKDEFESETPKNKI